jgi:hypothetical protein
MATYYNLAHRTKPLEYSAEFPWPFDIDVCFETVQHPIAFSEGVGFGSAGCAVSAEEALTSKWKEHFEITDGSWLIAHLERLVQGIALPQEEMLRAYEQLHGKAPTSYESKF